MHRQEKQKNQSRGEAGLWLIIRAENRALKPFMDANLYRTSPHDLFDVLGFLWSEGLSLLWRQVLNFVFARSNMSLASGSALHLLVRLRLFRV
jgi:hypothetical protein